ncbi:uracil-DNA glycosylase-like protein [Pilaira anomala]|nr:uracil-DNA glycosylase-like protein [Pilaira anomala]
MADNFIDDCIGVNSPLLFVGVNPGLESNVVRKHRFFAGCRNLFFKLLNKSGLVPRDVVNDDDAFNSFGISFVNYVARPTQRERDLSANEKVVGKAMLIRKINSYRPRVICFMGKMCCEHFVYR